LASEDLPDPAGHILNDGTEKLGYVHAHGLQSPRGARNGSHNVRAVNESVGRRIEVIVISLRKRRAPDAWTPEDIRRARWTIGPERDFGRQPGERSSKAVSGNEEAALCVLACLYRRVDLISNTSQRGFESLANVVRREANIMDFVAWTSFRRIAARYGGDQRVRTLNCAEQFRVLAFANVPSRRPWPGNAG
jgi:Domain of unknown function (DUF4372)